MEENKEHIWNLIARKFSGHATTAELAELELLLLQNPNESYSMEILNDLWNSNPDQNRQYSENKYKELVLRMQQMGIDEERFTVNSEIIANNRKPKIKKSTKWIFGITSFVITGLVFFVLLQKNVASGINAAPQQESLVKHEIKTKYGSKTSMVLPDGTKVWLNAGSKMTYDKDYSTNLREVNLTGEAYFDVVKDPAHPFIVHTSGIDIKALGTAFNVKAYKAEPTIEATLIHGMIEITKPDEPGALKVILKPHEKLIYNKITYEEVTKKKQFIANSTFPQQELETTGITISPIAKNIVDSAIIETSWVYNRLSFEDEKFENIAVKMERWFNVKIAIKNEKIKSYRLTGSFENETIDDALKELQFLVSFSYKISGLEIEIRNK